MLKKNLFLLAALSLLLTGRSSAAELKRGDTAPAFVLPGSDGTTYKLADFKNRKAVLVAWFPKAFTGG